MVTPQTPSDTTINTPQTSARETRDTPLWRLPEVADALTEASDAWSNGPAASLGPLRRANRLLQSSGHADWALHGERLVQATAEAAYGQPASQDTQRNALRQFERDIWQASMRHIAYEGRCFVLSACQYLTRADAPHTYDCVQGNDPATVLIRGGSVIVGPLGDVLAGPVYDNEAVIAADIDLADIIRGKYDLDVAGHYARPDVFHLEVDEKRRQAVSYLAESVEETEVPEAGQPVQ